MLRAKQIRRFMKQIGIVYVNRESVSNVCDAEEGKSHEKADPEEKVSRKLVPFNSRNTSYGNHRNLTQLHYEQIHSIPEMRLPHNLMMY
jgi:hypothetical protein